MGIVFALLASLTLAMSQVVIKKSFDRFSPSITFFFNTLFGLLIWIPIAFLIGVNFKESFKIIIFSFISAVLSEAFFFYVLSKGRLCVTGTILATYPIYTILFSVFINKEVLSNNQYIFIAVTIIGTMLISLPEKLNSKDLLEFSKIGWALCGAIATGLADSMAKNAIDDSSAGTFLLFLALTQIPVGFVFIKLENGNFSIVKDMLRNFKTYKVSIIGSLLNVVGVIFLSLALQSTLASIASPITATNPAIMVLLSLFVLKESVTGIGLLGIVSVITGIVGVSMY